MHARSWYFHNSVHRSLTSNLWTLRATVSVSTCLPKSLLPTSWQTSKILNYVRGIYFCDICSYTCRKLTFKKKYTGFRRSPFIHWILQLTSINKMCTGSPLQAWLCPKNVLVAKHLESCPSWLPLRGGRVVTWIILIFVCNMRSVMVYFI